MAALNEKEKMLLMQEVSDHFKKDEQLEVFRNKIKESPEEFKVIHKPGLTGGGSFDISFIFFVLFVGGYYIWNSRRKGT